NLLTGLSVFSLVLVTIALIFGQESIYLSVLAFLSAALHLLRIRHYHVVRSLVDPMLWILHAGYMWLVFGLFLLGLSGMGVVSFSVALHALTVGCIGSMILGMICRVTLGHTGNNIYADVLTILAFVLMQGAAFI